MWCSKAVFKMAVKECVTSNLNDIVFIKADNHEAKNVEDSSSTLAHLFI